MQWLHSETAAGRIILVYPKIYSMSVYLWVISCYLLKIHYYQNLFIIHCRLWILKLNFSNWQSNWQPVAEVLAYLHVQISPISCWVVGSILACAWKKHWHSNYCTRPLNGGGETPRPVLLTGAKKSYLGCLITFELLYGLSEFRCH